MTSFLKIPRDSLLSVLPTTLMKVCKRNCVCLDWKQPEGIFYRNWVTGGAFKREILIAAVAPTLSDSLLWRLAEAEEPS